jgi:hypothetical protein
VQIEEPFGIIPIEDVCADITADVEAMVERQDIVTDLLVAAGVECGPRSAACGACGAPVAAMQRGEDGDSDAVKTMLGVS